MAEKAEELRSSMTKKIKTSCTEKVLKLANFATTGGLALAAFLRFLYCFGVGQSSSTTTTTTKTEAPVATPEP